MPDSASIKAFGINLMDPRHRPGATKAGLAQGSEAASALKPFWTWATLRFLWLPQATNERSVDQSFRTAMGSTPAQTTCALNLSLKEPPATN